MSDQDSLEELRSEVRDLRSQIRRAHYQNTVLYLIVLSLAARTSNAQALAEELGELSALFRSQTAGATHFHPIMRRVFDKLAGVAPELGEVKEIIELAELMLRQSAFRKGEG